MIFLKIKVCLFERQRGEDSRVCLPFAVAPQTTGHGQVESWSLHSCGVTSVGSGAHAFQPSALLSQVQWSWIGSRMLGT